LGRALAVFSLLGLLACGPQEDGLLVPPMTPGLGGGRPSPLALLVTPEPCGSVRTAQELVRAGPLQGAYADRLLLAEWANYDEQAITAAFVLLEQQPEWPCLRPLVAEALAISLALRAVPGLTPPRATPTLPPQP
jgi:hypothetical protein